MITINVGQSGDPALHVVRAALIRSVGLGLVAIGYHPDALAHVWINPTATQAQAISNALIKNHKILLFGNIPPRLAALCGFETTIPLPPNWSQAAECPQTETGKSATSPGEIVWAETPLGYAIPLPRFPFKRFDFADEWNNLGYGSLCTDGSLWSLACEAKPNDARILAEARCPGERSIPYVTLHHPSRGGAVLWWNRPVGPVDHPDWSTIETFLADWGAQNDLPCIPVLCELPMGYTSAVTMRLDCDEDIASARGLFDLYQSRNRPLSLAIMTGQAEHVDHIDMMRDVKNSGGSIALHSATHAPRWGGSFEACQSELTVSRAWIEDRLNGDTPHYAVSPFHHAPAFLPPALAACDMRGFVGGIINNDPEMLVARAGRVLGPAGENDGIITHSQQCMLHGDCMRSDTNDPLVVPKTAFSAACMAGSLFGYLDHPISKRYDYGWGGFEAQIAAHAAFLDYIDAEAPDALWLNLTEAMDWLHTRAQVSITHDAGTFRLTSPMPKETQLIPALRYQGRILPTVGL